MVDCLIDANLYMRKVYLGRQDLYLVATFLKYEIYVATALSPEFQEGEIIFVCPESFIEEDNKLRPWSIQLAKDFKQFLIIAANLEQIYNELNKDQSNYEQQKQELLLCLIKLKVSDTYSDTWMGIF